PMTTAGPASPGTGPSLYQPAWPGSDGTWMVPSDARPRSVTAASTPIAGMRMWTGSGLWRAPATGGDPEPPSTGIGVVTGMTGGVPRGGGRGVGALAAATAALGPALVLAATRPAGANSAGGAAPHTRTSRTPGLF